MFYRSTRRSPHNREDCVCIWAGWKGRGTPGGRAAQPSPLSLPRSLHQHGPRCAASPRYANNAVMTRGGAHAGQHMRAAGWGARPRLDWAGLGGRGRPKECACLHAGEQARVGGRWQIRCRGSSSQARTRTTQTQTSGAGPFLCLCLCLCPYLCRHAGTNLAKGSSARGHACRRVAACGCRVAQAWPGRFASSPSGMR